jgi:phage terminase small subunit
MTPRKIAFVNEYLLDLNAAKAARRAGYSGTDVRITAHRLLQEPLIKAEVEKRMADRVARTEIDQDWVLERWRAIVEADPNELSQYRRKCCRYCWGVGYAYQWIDEAEFARATVKAEKEIKRNPALDVSLPSDIGGYEFNAKNDPNAECPKCRGEGIGDVFLQDTRNLSPAAKLLYAGTKKTKDGTEIMMKSQEKALEMIARHKGMFVEKVDVNLTRSVENMTDEELLAIARSHADKPAGGG